MRKILIPTDFSENAWHAAVYALNLLAGKSCTFYFMHSIVAHQNMLSYLSDRKIKRLFEDAESEFLNLIKKAEKVKVNPSHTFETILCGENLNKGIENSICNYGIDLVVMGTKGVTGARELFFGSNTVSVIMSIKNSPVLIVPEYYNFVKPKQIAFPTDYNRFYHEEEIKPLKALAKLFQSKIRILHIRVEEELSDIQEYNLMMLHTYFRNFDFCLHWMPNYSEKAIEINDFVEQKDIDILVMINYSHSFIDKILRQPTIKDLGCHCKTPFLVIPE
jgi:nucleotide-binding universal stress UspA family protein